MGWMDSSDYLVIEETAAARIDDLRDEAASRAHMETPEPSRHVARPPCVIACDGLRSASIEAW